MAALPLQGLPVLDLTAHRAGPTAVRQLADWGADVIKIEPPGEAKGDVRRRQPPWLRLPEPAPQQARHDAEPENPGGARHLHATGERPPTWWWRTTAPT